MGFKKVGKYEIGRTIGEGTFGKYVCKHPTPTHCVPQNGLWGCIFTISLFPRVKFAVNTETGDRVAIKILDKQKIIRQGMAEQIKKEVSRADI